MLVNAKTMNLETGLESFFASLEAQSFGPQDSETLVNRGVIKIHIRNGFSQMKKNMNQLASLCKEGLPEFKIDQILLPIVTHRKQITPATFMKNYFQEGESMYNRCVNDSDFLAKCKSFQS